MTKTLKKNNESSVIATVELDADDLRSAVARAEEQLGKDLVIEGFRPGKAPREIVRKQLGEQRIREEALQIAVSQSLQKLTEEEKLDVLDQHDFQIKENSPEKLVYSVVLTLYPSVTLGTYKGNEVKKEDTTLKDEEVETVLADIAKSRKQGDVVPELTDEFARSLGKFSSLTELRDMVRSGLSQEKEDRERDRIRMELLRLAVADSKMSIPDRMVELQLQTMLDNFDAQLHAQGMELGPYLAHMKKTEEDLKKEWHTQAQEQVKMQLVMHAIARAERISVSPQELQEALQQQLELVDVKTVDVDQVRNRLFSFLLNQKIFHFLEVNAKIV